MRERERGAGGGPQRRRRRGAGFSLPELLVVLAIIGIGALVAFPLVSEQFRQAKVRAAADRFTVDLKAARMVAVTRRASVAITVDTSGEWYEYTNAQGQTRRMQMPDGVDIVSSTSPITFQPNGALTAPATTVIEADLSGGVVERWTVNTGLVGVPTTTHVRVHS